MSQEAVGPRPVVLTAEPDFRLGPVTVSPARRRIVCGAREEVIEPRWMEVLVVLGRSAGELVTRDALFARCWGAAVGDDSLNRAIAGLRRASARFGDKGFAIDTIKAAGYVLSPGGMGRDRDAAHARAWESWKRDAPEVDSAAIDALETVVAEDPADAESAALLALMLRHAAENAEPAQRGGYVERCEGAAAHAFAADPGNAVAESALIGLPPIYGDWTPRRAQLAALLARSPDCAPALHEMAILEMATGRPSAAVPIVERLLERFPHAPGLLYKRVYHLWTLGRLEEMDRVADRAAQLWPAHLAVAMARFWSLAGTGRLERAADHLDETAAAGGLPPPALAMQRGFLAALRGGADEVRRAGAALLAAGRMGPVQANAAVIQCAMLGALDEAFALAEGYYLGRGPVVVGLQPVAADAAITDQFRRVTQLLFIPATAALRADPRFEALVEDIGLAAHWRAAGIAPDFRCEAAPPLAVAATRA